MEMETSRWRSSSKKQNEYEGNIAHLVKVTKLSQDLI